LKLFGRAAVPGSPETDTDDSPTTASPAIGDHLTVVKKAWKRALYCKSWAAISAFFSTGVYGDTTIINRQDILDMLWYGLQNESPDILVMFMGSNLSNLRVEYDPYLNTIWDALCGSLKPAAQPVQDVPKKRQPLLQRLKRGKDKEVVKEAPAESFPDKFEVFRPRIEYFEMMDGYCPTLLFSHLAEFGYVEAQASSDLKECIATEAPRQRQTIPFASIRVFEDEIPDDPAGAPGKRFRERIVVEENMQRLGAFGQKYHFSTPRPDPMDRITIGEQLRTLLRRNDRSRQENALYEME